MMRIRTRTRLVPFVLCTIGLALLFLAGCRKEEAKPEIPASSPASYMNDPKFRDKLGDQRKARNRIVAERSEYVEKMKAMVDAKKAELKTDDAAKVKAALAESAEWKDLMNRYEELTKRIEDIRREQLKTVRERIAPKKEISK